MRDGTLKNYGTHHTALGRIRELEAQLGMPLTASVDDICMAWDRIEALEDALAARGNQPGAPASPAAAPLTKPAFATRPLFGLTRAMAANQKK